MKFDGNRGSQAERLVVCLNGVKPTRSTYMLSRMGGREKI
jgi:hypothetical protein